MPEVSARYASAPVWTPSPERIAQANLTRFIARVVQAGYPSVQDMPSLHAFSVGEPAAFWSLLWDFVGIVGHKGSSTVVDGDSFETVRWFPEARLNFAENLLRAPDARPALIQRGEALPREVWTRTDLYAEVSRLQQALAAAGVQQGTRVVACLPNVPQAVAAFLATASLGAIWSACAPDYGADAMVDRFAQIEPTVLFMAQGYDYAGKHFDLQEKLQAVLAAVPSIRQVVLLPSCDASPTQPDPRVIAWEGFLAPYAARAVHYARLPFDHPLYVVYTSGTTGKPKAIIHHAGGTLLQYLKDFVLHMDLQRNDCVFWHTNTGWIIWNALVPALAAEASLVLFEGAITHPRPDVLLDIVQEERVQRARIPPPLLERWKTLGLEPARSHDLSTLRTVSSGGSPVLPHIYDYVFGSFKRDLHFLSPSGGTDVNCTLLNGNPISPLYAGEMQGAALGMDVRIFDPEGRPLQQEAGELVCGSPFPSVPLGFWGDPGKQRFNDTYFAMFPKVWRHGDWAEATANGGFMIRGRADATLKVSGVRIGTAEIYRCLEDIRAVTEAVAVMHVSPGGPERLVLFVVLAAGQAFDDTLQQAIRGAIRSRTTSRHVPALIVAVPDVPRSMNGKASEVAVRNAIHGEPVATAGLANPQSLDAITQALRHALAATPTSAVPA